MTSWSDIAKSFTPDPTLVSREDLLPIGPHQGCIFIGDPVIGPANEMYATVFQPTKGKARFVRVDDARLIRFIASYVAREPGKFPVFDLEVTRVGGVHKVEVVEFRSFRDDVSFPTPWSVKLNALTLDFKSVKAAVDAKLWNVPVIPTPTRFSGEQLQRMLDAIWNEL